MNWVALAVVGLVVVWAAAGTPIIWLIVVPWIIALLTRSAPVVYLAFVCTLMAFPIALLYRLFTCNGTC